MLLLAFKMDSPLLRAVIRVIGFYSFFQNANSPEEIAQVTLGRGRILWTPCSSLIVAFCLNNAPLDFYATCGDVRDVIQRH